MVESLWRQSSPLSVKKKKKKLLYKFWISTQKKFKKKKLNSSIYEFNPTQN